MRVQLIRPSIRLPSRVGPPATADIVAEQGVRTVLVGRSGHGKTLLLRMLCADLPAAPLSASGTLVLSGHAAADLRIDLRTATPQGLASAAKLVCGRWLRPVAQGGRENFVPGWSLRRHVGAWAGAAGLEEALFADRFRTVLHRLGLRDDDAFLDGAHTARSEGMNRRALLALALAGDEGVLVLDEPTTGLDPKSRDQWIDVVSHWLAEPRRGLILSTHDAAVARELGASFVRVVDGAALGPFDSLDDDDDLRAFTSASARVEHPWPQ